MKKSFFSAPLGILMGGLFAASASASHYENDRFGYGVDVPESFAPQPEAENGDGRVFISRSPQGEIAVGGSTTRSSGRSPRRPTSPPESVSSLTGV